MKESFTPQEAWLVDQWATQMIHGLAFTIQIDDYGISLCALFSTDKGISFKKYKKANVFYKKEEALIALSREVESYKSFCKKQVDEYSGKLKLLTQ